MCWRCVFVGLYVASAIYIALFMVILGKYPPLKSVLVGVVVNAVFFLMFEVWFKVPLFKGPLDPLASSATEPSPLVSSDDPKALHHRWSRMTWKN